jgi:chromosome segregation ATPase
MSQEIIGALDEVRLAHEAEQLASESELIAKKEVDQFVRLMEESGQRIEELETELASVTQEVENYRATLESVKQELDNLRFENSRVRTEFRRVMAGVRLSSGTMEI